MESDSIALNFRGQLLAGAALACLSFGLTPQIASAADVVCTPNASGTAIAAAAEACSGAGDKIDYTTVPATVSSTVTLNAVTISAATGQAVSIDPGTTSQTLIIGAGSSITALAGDGVRVLTATGAGTLSVGTSTNRIASPITGGNGLLAAQGIEVNGRGDVNVFTGAVAITSTSTGGGSWALRARSTPAAAGAGGAVMVDTQGLITGLRGGILATANGLDITDSVTVITTGTVNGSAGTALQTSSVNGNTVITASAPVTGSIGVGAGGGINAAITGTGTATINTLTGGTVTGSGGAAAIIVSSGSGGFAVNVGANVSSTAATAIRTANTGATGTNAIAIGTATIQGLGTSTTTSIIDMTTLTGGLTTLTTGATTSIVSNSTTAALQNADLALKGTGGSIVINNGGSLRGRADFSGISVGTNTVTFNNTSTLSWHTTGTSTFGAGNDALNNTGLLGANGATTLDFGAGTDSFNNNAGGSFFAAETTGASITTLSNLETFNNAGTITLVDGETNDLLSAASTAYVGSGAGTIRVDAFLGAGASQSGCTTPTVADCVVFGASSGTGTIVVNDTNTLAAPFTSSNITVAHLAAGSTANFVLGGSNVVSTPQGLAIQKGFVQYQLAFDATNSNYNLVTVVSSPSVELSRIMAGMQNVWQMTAEGSAERVAALRNAPMSADNDYSVWGKAYFGGFQHDAIQTVGSFNYDTTYKQSMGGLEVGIDNTSRDAEGAWILGALLGYSGSNLKFEVDSNKAQYTMWHFGVYASYMSGPWFVDILVKDDATKVKFDFPTASSLDNKSGNSFGAKATVGTRMEDAGLVFEPMASLAWVHSSLSNIDTAAASFDFDDGNSIRGTLGLRLSGTVDAAMRVQPFVFVGIGQEFDAQNSGTMNSGGISFQIKDKPFSTFGIGSVGLNIFGDNGFSTYVRVDGLAASHTKSAAVWAGLRAAL